MANTTNPLDILVAAQMALDALVKHLLPLNLFSTNFSNMPISSGTLKKGKTMEVRLYNAYDSASPGAGTGDFNKSTNDYATPDDVDWGKFTVPINQHKKTTFTLDDLEQGLRRSQDLEKEMGLRGQLLAELVLLDIYSLITNANFGAPVHTEDPSLFTSDDIVDIRGQVLAGSEPMAKKGLSMLINGDYYTSLLKDVDLKRALNSQTDKVLKEAEVPMLSGYSVFEDLFIPDNGENLGGFVTDRSGIAVAGAVLQPGDGWENVIDWATATDPVTGLTIGIRQHYDPAKGDSYYTIEVVYGRSVARAASLKRITTA